MRLINTKTIPFTNIYDTKYFLKGLFQTLKNIRTLVELHPTLAKTLPMPDIESQEKWCFTNRNACVISNYSAKKGKSKGSMACKVEIAASSLLKLYTYGDCENPGPGTRQIISQTLIQYVACVNFPTILTTFILVF